MLPEVYQHCHAFARYYCLSGARVAALLGFPWWQKPAGSASTQLALECPEVGVSQQCGVCSKLDKPARQPQATRTAQASFKGQCNCPGENLGSIMPCNFVLAMINSGLLGHLNIRGPLIISVSGRVVLGTSHPSHPVAVLLCTLTASKSGLCGHLDIQKSLAVVSVAWQCTELLAQTRLDGLLHGTTSKAP